MENVDHIVEMERQEKELDDILERGWTRTWNLLETVADVKRSKGPWRPPSRTYRTLGGPPVP